MKKHPLKIYRDENGIRAEDLANDAATTKQTIYRIESGVISPTLRLIGRICKAVDGDLSANDFMA